MIISHKLKLIYVKLYKVAGSSSELALSKYCGENDIVTSIGKDGDALRDSLGYFPSSRLSKRAGHLGVPEIKPLVSPDIWNDYLKVCSVRDPYDQCISEYFFIKDSYKKLGRHYSCMAYSFTCFIRYKYIIGTLMSNMEVLHIDGKVVSYVHKACAKVVWFYTMTILGNVGLLDYIIY